MLWGNGHHIIVKDANNSGIFYKIKMLCSHVAIRKHNERMWSSSCVKSEHKIYEIRFPKKAPMFHRQVYIWK